MRKLALIVFGFCIATVANAQTADEVIMNYFEATGGYEAWGKLENVKMSAKVNQGGMEIPLEIVQMKDGRQYTKVSLQGQSFYQGVFDGEVVWSMNFQSMKAEKADEESTANQKLDANDFPSDLYDYKSKGYTVELMGSETVEGTDTHKIKVTKEPRTIAGEKVDNIVFYFFDKDSGALLMAEQEIAQGPQKGAIGQSTMSDYDEVNGLYFPFSMTQGIKGQGSQPLIIDAIETNVEIDESVFSFPESGE